MIQSFRCKDTKNLFDNSRSVRFVNMAKVALRRLRALHAATSLLDLGAMSGNGLEALKDDRVGQHAIRINKQYRICFVWREGHAYDVEIVDYH